MGILRHLLPRAVCANVPRLIRSTRGNAALVFAIAVVPVAIVVGGAIDYASILNQQTRLQNATDSAALSVAQAAATLSSADLTSKAQSLVEASMATSSPSALRVRASYDASTFRTTVSADASIGTPALGLFGTSASTISRSSVAEADQVTTTQAVTTTKKWAVCLMVTAPSAFHTLYASGPTQAAGSKTWPAASAIRINNCMLQVNTDGWDAVETDHPNASIIGNNSEFCFHGGYIHNVNHHGTVTTTVNGVTPAYHYRTPTGVPADELASPGVWDTSCPVFQDPLQGIASPLAASACKTTGALTINSTHTLTPGRYCGNITITGGTVTFSPGFYQIDGALSVSGTSTKVTADAVTIYLNGSTARFTMTGGTVSLSPSVQNASDPLAGVALYVNNAAAQTKCAFSDANPNIIGSSGPGPAGPGGHTSGSTTSCVNAVSGGSLTYSGLAYFRYMAFWVNGTGQVTGNRASLIAEYVATDDTGKFTITGIENAATAAQLKMQQDSQAGYTVTQAVTTTTPSSAKLIR